MTMREIIFKFTTATAVSLFAAFCFQFQMRGQSAQNSKMVETWMVTVSNVHKDPEEEYGHGEGDRLTLLVHTGTAVAELSELEGSQQDPPPICMTGTFQDGRLHLENHPGDYTYEVAPISIDGRLSHNRRVFHGRIRGGPFHSGPTGNDSRSADVVTLRASYPELESESWAVADRLNSSSCACIWKNHLPPKSFITAPCDAAPENR